MEQRIVLLMVRVKWSSIALSIVVSAILCAVVGHIYHGEHFFNMVVLVHIIASVLDVAAVVNHQLVCVRLLWLVIKSIKWLSAESNHELLAIERILVLKCFLAVPLVLSR
jgi:hypothetical protein